MYLVLIIVKYLKIEISGTAVTASKNEPCKFDYSLTPRSVIRRQSVEKVVKDYCNRTIRNEGLTKLKRKQVRFLFGFFYNLCI